jgi:hypothetical protein
MNATPAALIEATAASDALPSSADGSTTVIARTAVANPPRHLVQG